MYSYKTPSNGRMSGADGYVGLSDGLMVIESELLGDGDNADDVAADANINFGFKAQNATQPEVSESD
jgi:hypothetical protein